MMTSYEPSALLGSRHSSRGSLAPQHTVTRNAALAEGKIAVPHRFFLVDGRIIDGFLFRGVNSRLVDELYGQKGSFVSVVDASYDGKVISYMAINERHIVSIEELDESALDTAEVSQ